MTSRVKEILVATAVVAILLIAFLIAFNGSVSSSLIVSMESPRSSDSATALSEARPDSGSPAIPVPAIDEFEPSACLLNLPVSLPEPMAKLTSEPVKPPRPAQKNFSCAGQICVDADTGRVLSARNEMVRHPPASVTKLMTLYLILEAVSAGELELETPVRASRRAQSMGGTQVYLAEGEVNSVEDLLYALMLQSANDAAVALAEKLSGNVENFVGKMNEKAKALGMENTCFSTPHGLPISKKERADGKQPDMTTAEDLAVLSRALIRDYPQVFRFSAAKNKNFRANQPKSKVLAMKNHNKLLTLFPGCDGLKTGWTNAGASIVTTASRGNRRVIAVVLGGIVPAAQRGVPDARASQRERNQRAAELMYDGLEKLDALKYEPTPNLP